MAKGRMLNKKISVDDRVHKLSNDTARLLFTWLIPNLDVNGCFYGDPALVKSLIFPRRIDISVEQIQTYLSEMAALELIRPYSNNGDSYLFAPGFKKNQTNLREDREGDSGIPPYDGVNQELIRSKDGLNPDQLTHKIREDKINIREDKINIREDKINIILPDFVDKELWDDFMEMRIKKRIPNTNRAKQLLINRLTKFKNDGFNPNSIIENSIVSGWTGVFQPKDNEVLKNGTHQNRPGKLPTKYTRPEEMLQ